MKIGSCGVGWEWESPWEMELSSCVDKEGWAYAPDWAAMDWPPQHGAQVCMPSCTCSCCLADLCVSTRMVEPMTPTGLPWTGPPSTALRFVCLHAPAVAAWLTFV